MNISVENCSSCAACANVCTQGAIIMRLDNEGFYRPIIDASKCIECGLCKKICPWTTNVENPHGSSNVPKTLAAYVNEESIRLQSSSGGIFTILAEKILKDGGAVVGVAQLSSTRFGHVVVENKNDLARLQGSKYVQADVGTVYKDVRKLLKAGRKVLFSGTPCQVAGLYAALGKSASSADLFTVDVVCHGTPSVKVFEKYIVELESVNQSKVASTQFRDKRKGWRLFSMSSLMQLASGKKILFSKTLRKDPFMRAFLENICLNTSCADCHYGKLPRIADITLGDYWNIACVHPEMDDNKGTSVVLLNTCHGKDLFGMVESQMTLLHSKIEFAIDGNPCIVRSSIPHPKRNEFLEKLGEKPFNSLVNEYFPPKSPIKELWEDSLDLLRGVKNKMKKIF
ncbi:Coenzyme F420 hydrogenase/dehydrogenase, beta subunit C-terminal domain [uncultured Fibrobacter sp.]|uniref:Coenzyme F420 hydrogenase/dehydrogenase, beta subunit C-terminal domain n=1 Tax=uncultured Fibrobacter sp. TaxID=261512 RepID=UPI00262F739E|nr:Coenzyme F420 hydrogenase/dehydrogenase, beta subunit C-terminal domain [uncultured Fibrobacter sp.]